MLDVAILMFTKLKWSGDSGSVVQFYQVRNEPGQHHVRCSHNCAANTRFARK